MATSMARDVKVGPLRPRGSAQGPLSYSVEYNNIGFSLK